jgi:hypothetical protein
MLRFLLRHGAVRMIGGRAVPVLMLWDAALLANRVRRIPVVDRSLRRGAAAAVDRFADTIEGFAPPARRGPRPGTPPDAAGTPPRTDRTV